MTVVDRATGEITHDLAELEEVIERGLTTFIDVGIALMRIRDGKKYREAGHATFEHYCQARWNWSTSRARQLMSAAATAEAIKTVTDVTPSTESDVRRLNPLPAEQRAEAWAAAVEAAGGEQPTAAQVQDAVDERRPDRSSSGPHTAEPGPDDEYPSTVGDADDREASGAVESQEPSDSGPDPSPPVEPRYTQPVQLTAEQKRQQEERDHARRVSEDVRTALLFRNLIETVELRADIIRYYDDTLGAARPTDVSPDGLRSFAALLNQLADEWETAR